jgi:hypothetical protein
MKVRFTSSVEDRLRKAGWYPGRKVPHLVSNWKVELSKSDRWTMFPKAEEALTEFGGLFVESSGVPLDFRPAAFYVDPSRLIYESECFKTFEAQIGRRLYPLGELDSGIDFIGIDEKGWIYHLLTYITLQGRSFDEALEYMILGKRFPEEYFWGNLF